MALLQALLAKLLPVPDSWSTSTSTPKAEGSIDCLPCDNYAELVIAWRKALRWTDGLDHALAAMLASISSTKVVGDQLWLKVVGPAACGKSTLCEALSTNTKYVVAKSTIRGFHSGYRLEEDGRKGGSDCSLIPTIRDKTLVTKDGDTLLQSPNLSQILSEARDLYDTTARTSYRNAMSHDYSGVRMTWILCGTASLRQIDSSELGERFLDVVIMEGIDDELEDEVLWRVANRANRNMGIEANGKPETQYEPELAEAMRRTGGYVTWLREHAVENMAAIETPTWALRRCMRLGKFVAYLRARPSRYQEETAEREFAARLVSQLTRLAKCLALVLNLSEVDEQVMQRVRRVALDTGRGQTLTLMRYLHDVKPEKATARKLGLLMNTTEERAKSLLRFLRSIEAVESHTQKIRGYCEVLLWRLAPRVRDLYEEVLECRE